MDTIGPYLQKQSWKETTGVARQQHHQATTSLPESSMGPDTCNGAEKIGSTYVPRNGEERRACLEINPAGFRIRHPPPPHKLDTFVTPEELLFETIHMGAAVVDVERWQLVIDGLVMKPLTLTLDEVRSLPSTTITAFHECYGSPLKPPVEACLRIGNVSWTGVRLGTLLERVNPLPEARFVWSDGLDYGKFAGISADRYQKDLPLEKAMSPEVLLAYEVNGKPLRKERGGPLRLVVPGWFGANMTKWLCRLSLQPERAKGPYTTTLYNELDPTSSTGKMRPVWKVEPNSMIVSPAPNAKIRGGEVVVSGWAWCNDEIEVVEVTLDGITVASADVTPRKGFTWQHFETKFDNLSPGSHKVFARARASTGEQQPLSGRRNHVHSVEFEVEDLERTALNA